MSFFPGSFISHPQTSSFGPLFRLLEDFENYQQPTRRTNCLKSFQPKFDVAEHESSYELHGELPGIDQKDIEIEFTDRQTLTVRGRTERQYTTATSPAGVIEGEKSSEAITERSEHSSHQATVEDADENQATETETQVAAIESTAAEVSNQSQTPQPRYWVSERSVGQFSRSFSFPDTVDQEAVKASMKNGILSILVPKQKKHEARKIQIE